MKTYLIDGYNLGHKIPLVVKNLEAKDFERAIQLIVQTVQQRINTRQNRVIIVFDGRKGVFAHPMVATTIEIKFARKPQEADDVIRNFLRQAPDASSITVISSDREILNTAKDLGAKSLTSEQFYKSRKHLSKSENDEFNEKPDVKDIDIDYWLEQFNKGNDEDS
ncbi:NYN domain-containing protein [Calditrichota bacterium GD2]